MRIKQELLLFGALMFGSMPCFSLAQQTSNKSPQSTFEWTDKQRAEFTARKNDPSQWNLKMLQSDLESNQNHRWPTKAALSNFPSPVPKYSNFGGLLGGIPLKIADRNIKATIFAWGKHPVNKHRLVEDHHNLVVYLNLFILTDDPKIENGKKFMVSRTYPHVLATGKQKTSQGEVDWVCVGLADGNNYAFINQRVFDLNHGATILVAPQRDGSLRFLQLDDTPVSLDQKTVVKTFTDYNQKLEGNQKVVEFFTNDNAIGAPWKFPDHRTELLELEEVEQQLRGKITGRGVSNFLSGAIEATDRYHADRLAAIIDEIGWPTRSKVGVDGAHAAWSIAQHAVFNPPLMKRCLDLMKPHFGTDEISGVDFAYLTDRFASVCSFDQQSFGIVRSVPIRDEHLLAQRRAKAGFEVSYAEYSKQPDYQPPTAEEVAARELATKQRYESSLKLGNEALANKDFANAITHYGAVMSCNGFIQTEDIYVYAQLRARTKSPQADFQLIRTLRALAGTGFADQQRLLNEPAFEHLHDNPLWKELVEVIGRQ